MSTELRRCFAAFGRVHGARIIAARPFSVTAELVTRGVIPEGVYDKIASELTVIRR
jgi:metal-dependent HD superfamily phosphatase/phosphodiesterase